MTMRRKFVVLAFGAAALSGLSGHSLRAQTVPTLALSTTELLEPQRFGLILSVRELPNGSLLVNDAGRRQLVLVDRAFRSSNVVLDSAAAGTNSYGPTASAMIPFIGDTTLFVDGASSSLLKFGPTGNFAAAVAAPKPTDIRFLASSASGVDTQGNLLYRVAPAPPMADLPSLSSIIKSNFAAPDSFIIVRANFNTRTVDTVGRLRSSSSQRTSSESDAVRTTITVTINPLVALDEWAVLSDGTVAIVRGRNYDVEFWAADGKLRNSQRIPFAQRRLTDVDKQHLIDSARVERDRRDAALKSGGSTVTAMSSGGTEGRVRVRGGASAATAPPIVRAAFVSASEIPDYWPAINAGAAKADLDGNLWVLPRTSEYANAGELVYDKIDGEGNLVAKVRTPAGRSIIEFGKGGVVYLASKDGNGWQLERTRLSTKSCRS